MNIKKLKTLSRVTCEATVKLSNAYKAAKEFVDAYEHEEHEQRHQNQAVPVNRNEERNKAFMALTDAIFTSGNITEVQQAAKAFVDICNREEREERHEAQEREMTSEDFECLLKLAEAVRRKLIPDHVIPDNVCDEEKHESPKPKRKWSSKKQRAYGKLLDCAIGRMKPDEICDAAIELAQACKPEHEKHERRHFAQAVPVNWSGERDKAYHDLTEAIFKHKPLSTIQKAAITFADICNREERRKPETSDVYQDIFGNRYIVFGVHDSSTDGEQVKEPVVVMAKADDLTPFSVPLEDFMNPTFKKV